MSSLCGLYGIADASFGDPLELGLALLETEICALQVRCKRWSTQRIAPVLQALHPLCQQKGVPLLVNDHTSLATLADGVHLGQHDGPILRKQLPPGCIVGRSTHSVEQAIAACKEGADYLGFGPVFATETKQAEYSPRGTGLLRTVVDSVEIPVIAIGGIAPDNVDLIQNAGASGWAPISNILGHENPVLQAMLFTRKPSDKLQARHLQAEFPH